MSVRPRVLYLHAGGSNFFFCRIQPVKCPEGARLLVAALPALLTKMLGATDRHPRTIFSDRGPGFFHKRWGTITGDYEHACREHGFKTWCGTNSKEGPRAQPPDIGDVLLHETSVSWLRRAEERCRPKVPWQETRKQFAARFQRCVKDINKDYDVLGLCKELPERLQMLVKETQGDRLPK